MAVLIWYLWTCCVQVRGSLLDGPQLKRSKCFHTVLVPSVHSVLEISCPGTLRVRLWWEALEWASAASGFIYCASITVSPSYKDWTVTFTVFIQQWLQRVTGNDFMSLLFALSLPCYSKSVSGSVRCRASSEPLSLFISGSSLSLLGLVLKTKLGLKTLHFKVSIESWNTKLCTLTICTEKLFFYFPEFLL